MPPSLSSWELCQSSSKLDWWEELGTCSLRNLKTFFNIRLVFPFFLDNLAYGLYMLSNILVEELSLLSKVKVLSWWTMCCRYSSWFLQLDLPASKPYTQSLILRFTLIHNCLGVIGASWTFLGLQSDYNPPTFCDVPLANSLNVKILHCEAKMAIYE